MQIHCPHCKNPVEVVDQATMAEISCPSCGSRFGQTELATQVTGAAPARQRAVVGHFELLAELGTGAFGTVWKAKDLQLDRIVAVKIPRWEQVQARDIQNFLREARTAGRRLRHPNIVSVHEVGQADGSIYIVSDFVEGVALDAWLQTHKPTPRQAAALAATIADALQHAHASGVIHRDLKPANILVSLPSADEAASELSGIGIPHITDFGLAKRDAAEISMTVDGGVLGTPAYMPPEQARGHAHLADARSDVYSLGVILYELLAGQRPFLGEVQLLLQQVLHQEASSPRSVHSGIPRDLDTICLKCLQKNPAQRYAAARDLAEDLRRFLRDEPITARPVSTLERAARWCRRNRAVSTLTVTTAVVLLLGVAASTTLAVRSNRNASEAQRQTEKTGAALGLAANEKLRADIERATARLQQQFAQEQRQLAERGDYNVQLARVRDALVSDPGKAEALLNDPVRCPPQMRDVTWQLYRRMAARRTTTLKGHDRFVKSVAIAPNGWMAASGDFDHQIKLWDLRNGKELASFPGHHNAVECVCFAPDGRTLVSVSYDETIRLWDVHTSAAVDVLNASVPLHSAAWKPSSRTLAVGCGDGTVQLWDLQTKSRVETLTGHTDGVVSLSWSPDGNTLATASTDGKVGLWNRESRSQPVFLEGHVNPVRCVTFSPDGTLLASAGEDSVIRLWDASTGRGQGTLSEHTIWVRAIAFSPDGRTLASDSNYVDYAVTLWDLNTRQPRTKLKPHGRPVTCVAFAPHNGRLLSGSEDGTLRLWDAAPELPIRAYPQQVDELHVAIFSRDGKRVATAGSTEAPTITIRDTATGAVSAEWKAHRDRIYCLDFSADGARLASTAEHGVTAVWDVATGDRLYEHADHAGAVYCCLFACQDRYLVTCGADATIRLREADTGKILIQTPSGTGPVFSIVMARDEETFFTANNDGSIREYETVSLQQRRIRKGHLAPAWSLALSPDGQTLASASSDNTIRLWDMTNWTPRREIYEHRGVLAFSPDGETLATATDQGTVELWDPVTGQERGSIQAHKGWIYTIAFSPDGRQLATAGEDHILRLWDLAPQP